MEREDARSTEGLLPNHDGAELMDELIQQVDAVGGFQKLFNGLFNFCAVAVGVTSVYTLVLAMEVPDHWCYVPGRASTNFNPSEWKNLTLPRGRGSEENNAYSKCEMYNLTGPMIWARNTSGVNVTSCQYGWEYDRRWFSRTVPSQENWVCDKSLYVTNTFVATQIGEAVGTISFGHMSDTIGRRPVFLLALTLLIVGRGLSVVAAPHYYLYLVTVFIGHSSLSSLCFAATTTGIELSSAESRARVVMLQSLGWTGGMCLVPLVAWLTGDWVSFVLLPLFPAVAILICAQSLFPESPRWLASGGKILRCMRSLRYIARINKQLLPASAEDTLRNFAEQSKGVVYGPASFMSSVRLATNTVLLVICWMLNAASYIILLLNVNNMSGNPYYNFFWQSAVEFPAGFAAKWLSDRLGRRSTHTVTFLVVGVSCFGVTRIVNSESVTSSTGRAIAQENRVYTI
ncbi:beta-alanine transporter isoform X2 [Cryptotermes secundus]|uniref:beta-alanine transporter isoform X2 n=1 Tax=Cryptotermes secundus TaxID=105785 RepID=UPI000CD7CB80|nr:beta-alanine transporter isoform X2 [Cryptotermes secundus]